jgi:hypothetical protein
MGLKQSRDALALQAMRAGALPEVSTMKRKFLVEVFEGCEHKNLITELCIIAKNGYEAETIVEEVLYIGSSAIAWWIDED